MIYVFLFSFVYVNTYIEFEFLYISVFYTTGMIHTVKKNTPPANSSAALYSLSSSYICRHIDNASHIFSEADNQHHFFTFQTNVIINLRGTEAQPNDPYNIFGHKTHEMLFDAFFLLKKN